MRSIGVKGSAVRVADSNRKAPRHGWQPRGRQGGSWDSSQRPWTSARVLSALGLDVLIGVDGAGATRPDDCGGIGGYEDFVAAMRDPAHPERDAMQQWSGCGTWDPAHFDILAVNQRLDHLRR